MSCRNALFSPSLSNLFFCARLRPRSLRYRGRTGSGAAPFVADPSAAGAEEDARSMKGEAESRGGGLCACDAGVNGSLVRAINHRI